MIRTYAYPETARSSETTYPPLRLLLSCSDDDFYGRLQRIWNNVLKLEDMGIIQDEHDKFMYAYQFAEAELQRACSERDDVIAANAGNWSV